MRTSLGQAMDLHLAPEKEGKPDLDKFTMDIYDNIAKFKTAYYSFYLPVAVAMHLVTICIAVYKNRTHLIVLGWFQRRKNL